MQRLTSYQCDLLSDLQTILADGPKNTHRIAVARGDRQAYETNLRNRLFVLADKGYLTVETMPCQCYGWAAERRWSLAPQTASVEG